MEKCSQKEGNGMKGMLRFFGLLLAIVSVILPVEVFAAGSGDPVLEQIRAAYSGKNEEVRVIPKIDNFIILLDQSGSMFIKEQGKAQSKAEMAKKVVAALNERIPELGYKGSLVVFAPDKTLINPTEYNRAMFNQEIERLPDTGQVFDNQTPLGDAILGLNGVLSKTAGKTAVLIVSDGDKNVGIDALPAAITMHEKYPNVCFDALSFSADEKGKATLKGISQLGDCLYVDGSQLLGNPAAVDTLAKDIFYTTEVHEVMQEVVPVKAAAVIPEPITLEGVKFGFDKFELSPQDKMNLDQDLHKLSSQPDLHVVIKGYTDSTGPEEYNQKLSERRAQAVYDYFASKGISGERMKTLGYGESDPVANNSTRQGRALNRRAEISPAQ
jgi:OOP family OmpA-OmpF porin